MSKKTYDLRFNSHGSVDLMSDGFFRKTHRQIYGPTAIFPAENYIEVELPLCIYRIDKSRISDKRIVKFLKRAEAHQAQIKEEA